MPTTAAYVHIPFCAKKCGYCDFNAYSGYKDGTKARYVDALVREIIARSEPNTQVPTVFFGGGTPTQLSAADLGRILNAIRQHYTLDGNAEITVEANPGDVSPAYLKELREVGFNRLSFGVQTFNDRTLALIDRVHSGEDAKRAIYAAREAGFDNISLDLMFALPRQTLRDWERAMNTAFTLPITHLSMYALIVEEGTPFYARRERGRLILPSEKSETAMFERAMCRANDAGFRHYEISNYALPGFECRHNQTYWRNESYFGFGAGAVGYLNGVRQTNVKRPSAYIEAVHAQNGYVVAEEERLTQEETIGETMMVGLRQTAGIVLNDFAHRFGVRLEEQYKNVIAKHTATGLLVCNNERLHLTYRGVLLAHEVMVDFLC